MKRKFNVVIEVELEIELDQKVIDAVDDDWRSFFYPSVKTPNDVAEHIARVMAGNSLRLSDIDGFANLEDNLAEITYESWGDADIEEIIIE